MTDRWSTSYSLVELRDLFGLDRSLVLALAHARMLKLSMTRFDINNRYSVYGLHKPSDAEELRALASSAGQLDKTSGAEQHDQFDAEDFVDQQQTEIALAGDFMRFGI